MRKLQPTVQGLEPEQVLVMETIGEHVRGLAKAAARMPGMEWLAEMDLDDVAPEAGFERAKEVDKEKPLPCRLYAVMTNQQAMDRLLGLWNDWCHDPTRRAAQGLGPFKDLFINLRDLRRWGADDRIRETGLVEYLQERLGEGGNEIRFEVELWCRQDAQARRRAYQELEQLVRASGGQCIAQSAIPDISYHGVLVKMPAMAVKQAVQDILFENYGPLVRCESVMFFRPFAQARFPTHDTTAGGEELQERFVEKDLPSGEPVAAILDGLPLEQHFGLRHRLLVDDPVEFGRQYEPRQQQHGTAMASLVVHGDLNGNGEPLRTPVYVRPILVPQEDFRGRVFEVTPDNELLVDLLHRNLRDMLTGEGAAAPTVKLINLSFANSWQPFDRELSPLARLLDWLSWKHKVLFFISVGNHLDDIALKVTKDEWRNLSEQDLVARVLTSLCDGQIARRPFSPAEAINALTVGAMHADESDRLPHDRRIDLLGGIRFPSPIGSLAHGYRRSVKPEIFFPGGRQLYEEPLDFSDGTARFRINDSLRPPGQRVAAPGVTPFELARTVHTRGTSNATALATRCGVQIIERLADLSREPGGDRLREAQLAVLVKCLLAHGASWGSAGEIIEQVFRETVNDAWDPQQAWREMDRLKARFLGYGEVAAERAMFCTDTRVTALGWADIGPDQGHVFQLPLPPALGARKVKRRLTVTLAWLTPINPQHRSYRRAYLWCTFPEDRLGVSRAQIDSATARRGTVEHRVLEGDAAVAIVEDATLDLTVSCKPDAGALDEQIPYALATTIEVAEPLEVSIFQQVQERIRRRVEVRPDV